MWGIPIGFLTANFAEWAFHKYVLHGLGKNHNSFWADHWKIHHKTARKNLMVDNDYQEPLPVLLDTKEFKAILAAAASVMPLIIKFPYFVTTVWICGAAYYIIHRRSHLDHEWAKKYVPWHFDHHLGKNQDKNWNVTIPIADYILGTRVSFH